ncbi:cupin-like domain-containing protein [Portibacter marinus]|uniref:cupin-like domain-containing protein n=1 Tax=Portibacter marinus TaxID=2898660 RepID=UPI001F300F11|nr:cupin-like domain-containing protein [Portibacter marinus]
MKLKSIERISNISKAAFTRDFLKPRIPVIIEDFSANWEAISKWSYEWLKESYGDLEVSLIDKNFSRSDKYFQAKETMDFGNYLELLEENKSLDLRLFLFDIFKEAPELKNDIDFPDICSGFIKNYKFLFFGGKGSVTHLHYDLDCSHVFLTQFHTRKKVILFSPDESDKLYPIPFTKMCKFDPEHPDFEKFPLAEYLEGYEAILGHGDTVFMPSMWWHYLRYIDSGFSLALRANDSAMTMIKGGINIVQHQLIDLGLSKVLGENWHKWKESKARERAEKLEKEYQLTH